MKNIICNAKKITWGTALLIAASTLLHNIKIHAASNTADTQLDAAMAQQLQRQLDIVQQDAAMAQQLQRQQDAAMAQQLQRQQDAAIALRPPRRRRRQNTIDQPQRWEPLGRRRRQNTARIQQDAAIAQQLQRQLNATARTAPEPQRPPQSLRRRRQQQLRGQRQQQQPRRQRQQQSGRQQQQPGRQQQQPGRQQQQPRRQRQPDASNNIIPQAIGAQITENFGGPFPAFRILAPHQTRGISCGLHGLANLHTVQTLLPADNELGTPSTENFVNTSQATYNSLERRFGCPHEQLSLATLLDYSHSSEYAIRNLYAFRYDGSQLNPAGLAHNAEYYDAFYPIFENSIKKLLLNDNSLNIINILLQVGRSQDAGHWTTVSIIKTASMPQPTLIFMDSVGNNARTDTGQEYKKAIEALQQKIMQTARHQ